MGALRLWDRRVYPTECGNEVIWENACQSAIAVDLVLAQQDCDANPYDFMIFEDALVTPSTTLWLKCHSTFLQLVPLTMHTLRESRLAIVDVRKSLVRTQQQYPTRMTLWDIKLLTLFRHVSTCPLLIFKIPHRLGTWALYLSGAW